MTTREISKGTEISPRYGSWLRLNHLHKCKATVVDTVAALLIQIPYEKPEVQQLQTYSLSSWVHQH